MDGRADSIFTRGRLACHCLLLETNAGLVLVDTGLGLRDVANPKRGLSPFFLALLSPVFRPDMTGVGQVEGAGLRPMFLDPPVPWGVGLPASVFQAPVRPREVRPKTRAVPSVAELIARSGGPVSR